VASHRIKQVEIEIEVGAVDHGQTVIERLSLLHPRRIAPLLDRVCSELSGPDRHDRIDTLELELGPIALDEFDDDFIRKLEAALRAALARQLGRQASERPETAALELLEDFVRTGNLPWWAERSDPITPQIRILLDAAPERWFGLLRSVADDPPALARLALHCDTELLEAIAARAGLARERMTELLELERWLIETRVFGSVRVAESRARSAWLAALGRHRATRPLELIAGLIGLAPIVLGPLRRAIMDSDAEAASGSTPDWLRVAATSMLPRSEPSRDLASVPANVGLPNQPPATALPNQPPAAALPSQPPAAETGVPTSLESQSDSREPESEVHELESEPTRAKAESPDRSPFEPREFASQTPDESSDRVEPIVALPIERVADPRVHPVRQPAEPPGQQAARRRALDRLETLYVDDAGLVILWPFLDRFFLRTGLIDLDRRFIDEQARMQAIALLAQLAFEEPEPPEFRLPLAKLLCGCSPEHEFTLERPLAPEQIVECDRLLAAVIENAPILRDATVTSFRANFVQRPAALSIREGAWLLEVEAGPHDIVLERFPWSWSWVKLAWMADPLFVRW
jgi:hypothetical protein